MILLTSLALLTQPMFSTADTAMLNDLQKRAVNFFVNETHPATGLTKDRAKNNADRDDYKIASSASTGYALAAFVIGADRGWLSKADAKAKTLVTLRGINDLLEHERGWSYHFTDWATGKREWKCEASTIDTSLLACGLLVAQSYWKDKEVNGLANAYLKRIDWNWALTDGGKMPDETHVTMGWHPETGFIKARWSMYCEHKLLYILGYGSTDMRTEGWDTVNRPVLAYEGISYIVGGPIFLHQMAEGWFDFSNKRDRSGINYVAASRNAILANRAYAINNPKKFKGYGPDFWGLNASDHPDGYGAQGAPGWIEDNGTISPTGIAASLGVAPKETLSALRHLRSAYPAAYGRYGFPNAMNPSREWTDPDVIGIDLGMMLVSVENARTGLIHRLTNQNPIAKRGMERAGLKPAPGSNDGPMIKKD